MDCKDNSHSGGGVSGGTTARLENFWYHYKWHTIAAIFAIFVIIVCTVQCATNTKYDIQVLYAGDHVFSRTSTDGSYPEYIKMSSTLADFADDYDSNGETNVTFLDLCVVNKDEYDKMQSAPPLTRVQEDTTTLKQNMDSSQYYICFLSERLFRQYSEGENNEGRFAKIAGYTVNGREYDYVSEYGIRLSSLDIKDLPGFAGLDAENTIVCIRNVDVTSMVFRKGESQKLFENSEDMLRTILAYESKK